MSPVQLQLLGLGVGLAGLAAVRAAEALADLAWPRPGWRPTAGRDTDGRATRPAAGGRSCKPPARPVAPGHGRGGRGAATGVFVWVAPTPLPRRAQRR